MKIIEKISEMIAEEIEDAEKYVACALKHRDEYPEIADIFYKISGEEMNHMAQLHNAVASLIKKYRLEHGDPPADMMAVYEYLHGKQIKKAAEVKSMRDMYSN